MISYKPRINVLHVENDPAVGPAFHTELLTRNMYVHAVDNLTDAEAILKGFQVDLLVSDGMFPTRKGEPEIKNFIPLVSFLKKNRIKTPVIAWSNSTHVHEFCRQEKISSFSKIVLTEERFKEKGRVFIDVPVKKPTEMADVVIEKLREQFGFYDIIKKNRFAEWYTEPITVLGAFLALDMRTALFKKTAGKNYGPILTEIRDGVFAILVDRSDDAKMAHSVYQKILHKNFFPQIKKGVNQKSARLLSFSRSLKKHPSASASNTELAKLYLTFCHLFISMRLYSSLPTTLEHGMNMWSTFLTTILAKRGISSEELNFALSTLTTPARVSYINEYEVMVAKAGLKRSQGKDITSDIQSVLSKFAWIHYAFEGVPITEEDIQQKLNNLGTSEADFENFLKKQHDRLTVLQKEKNTLAKKYALTKKELNWFAVGADIVFIKYFRKGVFAESYYNVEFLLAEIGKRIGLNTHEVSSMFAGEVLSALKIGSFPKELIASRLTASAILSSAGENFLLDARSRDVYESALVKTAVSKEIKGQVAYAGIAKGTVKIVNAISDMAKMKDGDVLVSRSTNPSLVPAMRKASAFVTDIGGLTCHAAIIAREMQKPCIVGTRDATKVLKDGDMVEVDAKSGVVRVLTP